MIIRNSRESYGLVSKLLHWLIAVPVLGLIPLGWYLGGLSEESVLYWRLLELHETLGIGVFTLALARIGWRGISPNPDLPSILPAWERVAARLVHLFFILALVFIPVLGFMFVASDGEPVELYLSVEIPPVGQWGKGTRELLFDLHGYLAYICAVLVAVHVLAALKHHFIDRRSSLRRIAF
ncbi:MAG: cytochrome b [Gammaproteobacteria bacterium]